MAMKDLKEAWKAARSSSCAIRRYLRYRHSSGSRVSVRVRLLFGSSSDRGEKAVSTRHRSQARGSEREGTSERRRAPGPGGGGEADELEEGGDEGEGVDAVHDPAQHVERDQGGGAGGHDGGLLLGGLPLGLQRGAGGGGEGG